MRKYCTNCGKKGPKSIDTILWLCDECYWKIARNAHRKWEKKWKKSEKMIYPPISCNECSCLIKGP